MYSVNWTTPSSFIRRHCCRCSSSCRSHRCTHCGWLLAAVCLCLFLNTVVAARGTLSEGASARVGPAVAAGDSVDGLREAQLGQTRTLRRPLSASRGNEAFDRGQVPFDTASSTSPEPSRRRRTPTEEDARSHDSRREGIALGPSASEKLSSRRARRNASSTTPQHRQELKRRLMSMFGFKKEPLGMKDKVKKPRVPKFMHDAFEHLSPSDHVAQEMRLCFDRDTSPSTHQGQHFRFRVKFGLNKLDVGRVVLQRAELHLFRWGNFTRDRGQLSRGMKNMVVSWMKKGENGGVREVRDEHGLVGNAFNASRPVVRVDVTRLVQQWRETKPKHGIQFKIQVRRSAGDPLVTFSKSDIGSDKAELFLITTVIASPETLREDLTFAGERQKQRVQLVAAWETLNKDTEKWEFNYRPPNSLGDEVIHMVQKLPESQSHRPPNPTPVGGRVAPALSRRNRQQLANTTQHLVNLAMRNSRPHQAVDQAAAWEQQDRASSTSRPSPSPRQPPVKRRKKRNVHLRRLAEQSRQTCHRESLIVTMHDLGWDKWVISPNFMDIGYCIGMCPWPLKDYRPSLHAIIQTLMSVKHPGVAPTAACVPSKIASVKIMYYDEDLSVVSHNYAQVEAAECSCR